MFFDTLSLVADSIIIFLLLLIMIMLFLILIEFRDKNLLTRHIYKDELKDFDEGLTQTQKSKVLKKLKEKK